MENVNNENVTLDEIKNTSEIPPLRYTIPSARPPNEGDNLPVQPFATLSKFIDSTPFQTYLDENAVPSLVPISPQYVALSETVVDSIARHPNCSIVPNFFWKDDIIFVKIKGVEVMAGDGRFGCVFLGCNLEGELLALKYYKSPKKKDNECASIINEAILQSALADQGVAPEVLGFGFIKDSHFSSLVLVSKFISAKPNCSKPLTMAALCYEDAARRRSGYPPLLLSHQYLHLLLGITALLATLDKCNVIHTDIKPDNILLQISGNGKQLNPYLIDFGSSFVRRDSMCPFYHHNTRAESEEFLDKYVHLAPEFLFDANAISNKSDLYGLGLILRDIGSYLEIPALGCVASKLRFQNPDNRPNCLQLCQLIRAAFGQDLFLGSPITKISHILLISKNIDHDSEMESFSRGLIGETENKEIELYDKGNHDDDDLGNNQVQRGQGNHDIN